MTRFISYAQNFEDVMLLRALKDVSGGFYIDVGAHHPVIDSVSKAFYDRGWRGIHVEPTAGYAALLRSHRPDEIVIQAAVSDNHEAITFFEMHGLSTGDADIAEMHRVRGIEAGRIVVPCLTLDDIIAQAEDRDIHWLKIDVEGMEQHVIRGWKTSRLPWIVVVESTIPNSPKENWEQWEPMLVEKGYEFVFFDGLNRYYVAPRHVAIKNSFRASPNVFDNFALHGDSSAPFCQHLNEKHRDREQLLVRETESLTADIASLRTEIAIQAQEKADYVHQNFERQRQFEIQIAAVVSEAQQEKLSLTEQFSAVEKQLQTEIDAVRERERLFALESAERERSLTSQLADATREKLHDKHALLRELLSMEQTHRQVLGNLQTERDDRERRLAEQVIESKEQLNREKHALFIKLLDEKQALSDSHQKANHEVAEKTALLSAAHRARERELHDQIRQIATEHERLSLHLAERERTLYAEFAWSREQLHRETEERCAVLIAAHRARERELQDQIYRNATEYERRSLHWAERERTLRAELTTRERQNADGIQALSDELDQRTERLHQAHRLRENELLNRINALNERKDALLEKHGSLQYQLIKNSDSLSEVNQELADKVGDLEDNLRSITYEKMALEKDLEQLGTLALEIKRIKASLSWRLTSPLRGLASFFGTQKPTIGEQVSAGTEPTREAMSPTVAPSPLSAGTAFGSGDDLVADILETQQIIYTDQTLEFGVCMKTIKHIDQLLETDGAEFVKAAYKALLNRSVDATGLAYYTGRLRAGYGKAKVIAQIARSEEARVIRADIPGLQDILVSQKRAHHWFTGWFARQSSVGVQVHRLEYVLGQMESRTDARLASIERNVEVILDRLENLQLHSHALPSPVNAPHAPAASPESSHASQRAYIVDGLTLPVTGTPTEIIAALEDQIAASREATSFNR
jgi:FkbM family methyltransferase